MKKLLFYFLLVAFICLNTTYALESNQNFPQAIKTCMEYSQTGSIAHNGEVFNILITLEKSKNKCVYKEKIFQDKNYQLLTCNFDESQLPFLSDSMQRFNNTFKKEIAKNKIFEAKMTTNGEIFQKYLANPKYCQITHSKK